MYILIITRTELVYLTLVVHTMFVIKSTAIGMTPTSNTTADTILPRLIVPDRSVVKTFSQIVGRARAWR